LAVWRSGGLTVRRFAEQIACVPVPLPPYALAAPVFPFRHLAGLAGRAPIGGAREVALACFVAARLAAECLVDGDAAHVTARTARSSGAKGWVATLALPTGVKGPLQRCLETSAGGSRSVVARELAALAAAAASYLDPLSRGELDALATSLKG
jgi:hypothetical protein